MSHIEDKMHFKDCRSGQLTNGIERSAHRALLYSTGLDTEDLKKPMVAVVNSFTEMVPGHYHLRELAEFVKLGIAEAGGVAREFSTIAICDGICQGHKGMSYPLPSREVIADSIEYMIEAHQFDAIAWLRQDRAWHADGRDAPEHPHHSGTGGTNAAGAGKGLEYGHPHRYAGVDREDPDRQNGCG